MLKLQRQNKKIQLFDMKYKTDAFKYLCTDKYLPISLYMGLVAVFSK